MDRPMDCWQCLPQYWQPLFQASAIKSHILPVSNGFTKYLLSDGLVLPQNSKVFALGRDELSDDENFVEVDSEGPTAPSFSELNEFIDNSIEDLGGKVFVKFNTKAPTDAAWINGGSLSCATAGDVYLLLKASTKVADSVESANKDRGVHDDVIVIKKWANLFPSMEFRCFVKNKQLLGISQRNCSDFFSFLLRHDEQASISTKIADFFEAKVKDVFPLDSYVMDIYVDKKQRVWLLDFGVFGSSTDPLLFSWDELFELEPHLNPPVDTTCDFRVILGPSDVFPHTAGASRGPIDLTTVRDPVALMMKLTQSQQQENSSDDDVDETI